jgi:NAD(P)-dependent dehydrogenase (short-subunit alcohol dehydrogenase family)
MKRTYVVTGAASGIGQATAALLRNRGHRVIGVDVRSVDVVADLSTPEGRQEAIDGILC